MIIQDKEYGDFTVLLEDDGTLDTIISVDRDNHPINEPASHVRFSQEYAADHRDQDGALTHQGFCHLAQEAIDEHIENYLS